MQFDAFSLNLNSCRVCYNEILKGLTIILLWCLIIVWIVPKFELLLKSANLCLKYPTSLPKLATSWPDQANWFELLSLVLRYQQSCKKIIFLRYPDFQRKNVRIMYFGEFCNNIRHKSKLKLVFYLFIVFLSWTV